MSARHRWGSVFVVAVLCVSVVAGGVSVASATTPTANTTAGTGNETVNGTTNGTSPHENPEEIDESGDDQQVANHLAARLGSRLNPSAVAISEGEYEQGRVPLDEEYETLLNQYAVVAADIDAEGTATRFNLTREQQLALAESIEETEGTAEAYQRAVENGDDERARELARDLLETAEEVNGTATDLNRQYAALEENTSVELDDAQVAIEEIQRNVGQATAVIVEREFTDTTLTATTDRRNLTTSDPATVSGRLTTANGTPIDNASVSVGIDGDTVTTRTDANGTFETAYRPLVVPVTATNLTVAYVPGRAEQFLPATATVPVTIPTQTETTLRLANATGTAGFGESVRATGTVRVTEEIDRSLAGIPVVLTVDGRRLATATTDAEGRVTLGDSLPASTPVGEATLQVAIDRRELAIARSTASTPITVRSTPTALSLTAAIDEGNESRTVTVTGRLTTDDGTPLAERPVRVAADGTDLGTVETNASGGYEADYMLPETAGGDSVPVTATFEGVGTNLAGTTARRVVSLAGSGPEITNLAGTTARRVVSLAGSGPEISQLERIAIGGGILVALVTALVFVWRRNGHRGWRPFGGKGTAGADRDMTGETAVSDVPGATSVSSSASGDGDVSEAPTRSLLATARDTLGAGRPDEAVSTAYMAIRSRLRPPDGGSETQTHWEFYRQWKADDGIDNARLRTVTEAYEAAVFAPDAVSAERASDAVTATTELMDLDPTTEDRRDQ